MFQEKGETGEDGMLLKMEKSAPPTGKEMIANHFKKSIKLCVYKINLYRIYIYCCLRIYLLHKNYFSANNVSISSEIS